MFSPISVFCHLVQRKGRPGGPLPLRRRLLQPRSAAAFNCVGWVEWGRGPRKLSNLGRGGEGGGNTARAGVPPRLPELGGGRGAATGVRLQTAGVYLGSVSACRHGCVRDLCVCRPRACPHTCVACPPPPPPPTPPRTPVPTRVGAPPGAGIRPGGQGVYGIPVRPPPTRVCNRAGCVRTHRVLPLPRHAWGASRRAAPTAGGGRGRAAAPRSQPRRGDPPGPGFPSVPAAVRRGGGGRGPCHRLPGFSLKGERLSRPSRKAGEAARNGPRGERKARGGGESTLRRWALPGSLPPRSPKTPARLG